MTKNIKEKIKENKALMSFLIRVFFIFTQSPFATNLGTNLDKETLRVDIR
ncbi:hypothetical protein MsAc7_13260 [Methanolapillus millepedarum]|uniref:Uncharacterized protein n=1 Tax=Methanolapillus millepedarum TaxID=3028296 RepID=A0AA96V4G6_9EURY|nr:hypothetical protein MsAc7_13260 [Methanosarcinaceae archaeon Ac7]